MKMTSAVIAALTATFFVANACAQVQERPLPRLVQKDGRYALFVDDAPYLILGVEDQDIGLESSWPGCAKEWSSMDYLKCNTVEIPIYWDEFEPQPGQYNYASTDRLLAECRQHNVRLIPLWFATYKNGSQHYMPEWMLQNPELYSHLTSQDGQAADSPSPFATASLEADKKAFGASCATSRKPIPSAPSSWCRWKMNPAVGAPSAISPPPPKKPSWPPCPRKSSPPCT